MHSEEVRSTRCRRDNKHVGKVHGRNLNARDRVRVLSTNFSVRCVKSLTIGVEKNKIIPCCDVRLTSGTYGEKK